MTLILATANQKEIVLVADRRLSRNGKIVESPGGGEAESNKALALFRPDVTALVAFTGLAEIKNFATHKWLMETLVEVSEPTVLIDELISRVGERATQDIAALRLPPKDRRLSIVLVGYRLNDHRSHRAALWRITNCEPPFEWKKHGISNRSHIKAEADRQFHVCLVETGKETDTSSMVFVTGDDEALPETDFHSLGKLVREGKSRKAIKSRAVRALRAGAESSKEKLIGRNCTSLALPSDLTKPIEHAYHCEEESLILPGPSIVDASDPNGFKMIIGDPSLRAESDEGIPVPVTFGKVPRNALCPCGSGVKFKRCHGA